MKRSKPLVFWTKGKADLSTSNNPKVETRERNIDLKQGETARKHFCKSTVFKERQTISKFAFTFHALPEIPKMFETHAHKKNHTTANLKCHKLWYFRKIEKSQRCRI